MRGIIGLVFLLVFSLPDMGFAQAKDIVPPTSRSSPRDTYVSFLAGVERLAGLYEAYQADKSKNRIAGMRIELARIRRLMDLSQLPPSTRAKVGNAAIGYLADIISRLPQIDASDVPRDTLAAPQAGHAAVQAPASWTIPGTDIRIVHIDEGVNRGHYLVAADSIANLRDYYLNLADGPVLNPALSGDFHEVQINATGPWISEQFVAAIPDALKTSRFETPLWKILAIILILLLAVCVSLSWTWMVYRKSANLPAQHKTALRMTAPGLVFVGLEVSEWFIASQINPAGTFAASEIMISTAIRAISTAWLVWLAMALLSETIIRWPRIPDTSVDANVLRLVARIIGYIAVATILAFGADALGIPALGLVAGLGVGGIAVALAAQPALENLFAGFFLFADRPYHIGDWISIGGQIARVERVGARASRLRNRDGTLCTVPNADMANAQVINYSERESCFFDQDIAVKGDTDPAKIERLMKGVRARFDDDDLIEKEDGWPRAYAVQVIPGQIRLRFQARMLTDKFHVFLEAQERILLAILSDMRDLGIEVAQPLPVEIQPVGR